MRPILHVRLFHPANDHYGMSHDGSWSVTTHGTGHNLWSPLLNAVNQWQGPKIFDHLDAEMRNRIRVYRGLK